MTDFQITTQDLPDNIVAISLTGDLDSMSASQLEETFQKFYNQGIYKFIVDLSGLSYISSRGAGVILKFLEWVRKFKGDMVLVQPTPAVKDLLDMLGLTHLITIASDQTTALKSLGQ